MNCPNCGASKEQIEVKDTRPNNKQSIRRRRLCKACNHRFSTLESIDIVRKKVIKRDNSYEPFDANKLRASIEKAVAKRPVSDQQIDDIVTNIKSRAAASKHNTIKSRTLAQWVMECLSTLDAVVYTRYASEYHHFEDRGAVPKIDSDQLPLFDPEVEDEA